MTHIYLSKGGGFFIKIMNENYDTEENAIEWVKMVYRQNEESVEMSNLKREDYNSEEEFSDALWGSLKVLKFDGSKDRPITPSFISEMRESQYRKGYQYGMVEAANFIEVLHRKGYSRLMEAHNFIWRQVDRLYLWRRSTANEKPLKTFGEPSFPAIETWYKMKQSVFNRDGNACFNCGKSEHLHCHHIEPVKSGGIAEHKNLITLCKECHKNEHKTR